MAKSLLRALLLRMADLSLVGPVGRFVVAVIYPMSPEKMTPGSDARSSLPTPKEGIKVIACGFPRSGTLSLMIALNTLGFRCYHGGHFYLTDAGFGVWTGRAKLWLRATIEENWNQWERLLSGYDAIVDFPAAFYYKKLLAAYPNAKVILNVRDPEQWYRSVLQTLWWQHNKLVSQVFRSKTYQKVVDGAMWEGKFRGRFAEKEFAISVYNSHVEEVKKLVPKEKLLVHETKDGWPALCEFLQVAIPNKPYPMSNDSSSMRAFLRSRESAFAVFSVVYFGLLSLVFAVLLKWGSRFFRWSEGL